MESDDTSLKQSALEDVAPSDKEPSGSMDSSLKQSELEDGEPPSAKKERLDSENVTQSRKYSTGKHPFS
jgi:hypothetical protein